jgi:hypothetical protein
MFSGIKKWLTEKGLKSIIPSLVRLALGALAGWLAASGYGEAADAVTGAIPGAIEVVSAVGVALFAIIWSLLEKAKTVPVTPKAEAAAKGVEFAVPPKAPQVLKH